MRALRFLIKCLAAKASFLFFRYHKLSFAVELPSTSRPASRGEVPAQKASPAKPHKAGGKSRRRVDNGIDQLSRDN